MKKERNMYYAYGTLRERDAKRKKYNVLVKSPKFIYGGKDKIRAKFSTT